VRISDSDIDSYGRIVRHGLHDAHVTAFSFVERGSLVLTLSRLDRSVINLTLEGVEMLGIVGFTSMPIVSEVYAWRPDAVPAAIVAQSWGPWAILFGNNVSASALSASIVAKVANTSAAYLVSIECSYGGAMAALCQSIVIAAPP
jgi:hypothetical protein